MDLEQLNKIDTSNAAQVKELQTFLKTRGYYSGPIDGKWGGGTTEGAVKLRTDLANTANTTRDTAIANQQANDPTNNAIRGATEFGPYAVGAGIGAWGGHAVGKGLTFLGGRDAAATKAMAADPKISGVAAEAKMGSMRAARNAATGAQFLAPAALLGSAKYMRDYVNPRFEGETKKWMDLGVNAEQGAGLGIAAHQLLDMRNRFATPADAADEARIETRAAAERAPAPPPNAQRQNSERLMAAARAAGATSNLSKAKAADFIANNITEANRAAVLAELPAGTTAKAIASTVKRLASKPGASSIALPLTAAALAYDAASGDAEAAGASPGEARTQGAVAGTGAAALTGGALYGASKLPAALRAAGGVGMNALAPYAISDMTDNFANGGKGFTPEEIQASQNQTFNTTARNTPSFLDTSAVRSARDMAQVPEPSPVRSVLTGHAAEMNGPLASANALQIPEDIPPNAARDAEAAASAAEGPSPARAAYGDQKFDAALQAFLGTIQEHNSSVGEQPPVPIRGNFQQAPAMIGAR